MTAIVDLPLADKPVIQTVTPFWPGSFSRSCRETDPSCQVMFVAFCSAIVTPKEFHRGDAEIAEKNENLLFANPTTRRIALRSLRLRGELVPRIIRPQTAAC